MHYNVISADCHLNEPPDTYTARVASKLHDRVPRVEAAEDLRAGPGSILHPPDGRSSRTC